MEANIETAKLLFQQKKFEVVINTCSKILAIDSNSIEALKLIAKSFLARRQLDDARLYLNKALNIKPDDYEVIKDLGNIYQAIRDFKKAKSYYQKAIEINSTYAPALTNLGSIQINTDSKQEALSLLIKATEYDPQLAAAWGNLANGYFQLGKTYNAEIACRKSIELNPNLYNSHFLLGTLLIGQNKLYEAKKSFKKSIELNSNFADAHYNLANILIDLGKTKEAEYPLRKSIEIKPNFFQAHLNLGIILKGNGQLKKAELSTRKAIEINPDLSEAHSNLGNILLELGKIQEAELFTRKAIKINPDLSEAHSILGNILLELGKIQEAFNSYLKAISTNKNEVQNYLLITQLLRDYDLSQINKGSLKNILNILLKRNDIRHQDLFRALNSLYEKDLTTYIEELESLTPNQEFLPYFIKDELITLAMKRLILKNLKWEKLLTIYRKHITDLIFQEIKLFDDYQLEFIIALGHQCFLNEYIYTSTTQEERHIKNIIHRCREDNKKQKDIMILACYIPLYKLLNQLPFIKTLNASKYNFKELINLQILEPIEEIKLSKNIKSIGLINNDISKRVRSQYEENPFPRWRYGVSGKGQKISYVQAINNEIKPNSISSNLEPPKLNVLIAGCGTGNQILQAQRYRNAQIICTDLSSASLSYAQRKINELGINNVELIQMDILDTELIGKQFDLIECGGVLHHMADPIKGLKCLLNSLKKDGYLKLGLYSEIARKDIVKAKKFIANKNLKPTKEDIIKFRKYVFSGNFPEIKSIQDRGDFYSISDCRDLCFHVQEHRFTIKDLKNTLINNKLKFLGFSLPQPVKSLYKKYFPADKTQNNLQNWEQFEEKHIDTFRGMYQFWVSKSE